MPGKKYLNDEELKTINSFHTNNLDEIEKKWFEDKCQKIQNETGYRLNFRASGDSAFRLYLIAEKGLSVDDVTNLDKLPKNTAKQYMEDFFNYLDDPTLSTLKKIERFGAMHKKAVEKILNEPIPDPGELKSLDDLAAVQKKLFILERLYIDITQDTEKYTAKQAKDRERVDAYSKGTGGRDYYEKLIAKWSAVSKGFSSTNQKLSEQNYNVIEKAIIFDWTKEFFKKYKGKKIGDVPISKAEEYSTAFVHAQVYRMQNADTLSEQEAKDYLAGNRQDFSGMEQARKYVDDRRFETYKVSNDTAKHDFGSIVNKIFEPYVAGLLTDDELKLKDLSLLSEEKKKKMLRAYQETLGKVYTIPAIQYIYDSGKDQYDMITTSDGKSINQIVGDVYKKYDSDVIEDMMKIETIRALIAEKEGLRLNYYVYNDQGDFELGAPVMVKKLPDKISIPIYDEVTKDEADNYFKNLNKNSKCIKESHHFENYFKEIFESQKDILDRYRLNIYDCIFIGDKSLSELYLEKTGRNAKEDASGADALLLSNYWNTKPLFITVLSEPEPGKLKRNVVPITFSGKGVIEQQQTREAQMEATVKYGNGVVRRLPKIEATKVATLEEMAEPEEDVYITEKYFKTVLSMFGAQQTMVPDLIRHKAYSKETFEKNYKVLPKGGFSNEEFATLAFFASMNPKVVTENPMPELLNLESHESQVRIKHSYWTIDIMHENDLPRENLGNHYMALAITPAREAVAKAIKEYSKKNCEPLAAIIATGIRETLIDIRSLQRLDNNTPLSHIMNMLNHLEKLIDFRDIHIRRAVESKLKPKEVKEYKALLKLKELQDARTNAENMLSRAAKNEIKLSDEERQLCNSQIETFNKYIKIWGDNFETESHRVHGLKEYTKIGDKIAKTNVELNEVVLKLNNNEKIENAIKGIKRGVYKTITIGSAIIEVNKNNAADKIKELNGMLLSDKAKQELELQKKTAEAKNSQALAKYERFTAERTKLSSVFTSDAFLNEKDHIKKLWNRHNPSPKARFGNGKYGKIQGYLMALSAPNILIEFEPLLDKETYDEINKYIYGYTGGAPLESVMLPEGSMGFNGTEDYKALAPEDNKRFLMLMKKAHDQIKEGLKNPPENIKNYIGYYELENVLLDCSHDTIAAQKDSFYITELNALTSNSLKDNKYPLKDIIKALSDEKDPETGRPAPICYIDDYYKITAELNELEYEKQDIIRDYSPEKEAQYLEKLTQAHERYIDNIERFYQFNRRVVSHVTGESKYDIYFQNRLDMFTGTALVNNEANRRNPDHVKGWMRGINQAVKNGWGIEDIGILGALGAAEARIDQAVREYLFDNQKINIESAIKGKTREIQQCRENIENLRKQLSEPADKENVDKRQLNNQINHLENEITRFSTEIDADKRILAKLESDNKLFDKLKKEINDTKKEVWNQKIHSLRDKIKIVEKVNDTLKSVIAQGENTNISVGTSLYLQKIQPVINNLRKQAAKLDRDPFLGRTIKQRPADLADDKYIEEQKYSFFFNVSLAEISNNFLPENEEMKKLLIQGENTYGISKDYINGRDWNVSKYSISKNIDGMIIRNYMLPGESEKIAPVVKRLSDSYKKYINNLPEEDKVFRPIYEMMSLKFDEDKGSIVHALCENPILYMIMTHTNFGPAIFRGKEEMHYITHAEVKKRLENAKGVLLPEVSYFEAVREVVLAEYQKQADRKKGWNKEAQKRYYNKLKGAYEKIFKCYEEMNQFPDEIQDESGTYNEDTLGDITGKPENKNRGLTLYVPRMKWQIQAMKNGWKPDDLLFIGVVGEIDGRLQKLIGDKEKMLKLLKSEIEKQDEGPDKEEQGEGPDKEEIKKQLEAVQKDLKAIKIFERETFNPFKRYIWDKKIDSPQDVLEVLNRVEDFQTKSENNPLFKSYKIFKSENLKRVLDDVSNRAIQDVKDIKKNPKVLQERYGRVELEENEDFTHDILVAMRNNKDIPASGAVDLLHSYVKSEYMAQLYRSDHPELFDKKHIRYESANKILDAHIKKYCKEFIDNVVAAKNVGNIPAEEAFKKVHLNGAELADLMKFGHHSAFYARLEHDTEFAQRKGGYDKFVNGIIINMKTHKKIPINEALDEAITAVGNAPEPLTASNVLTDAFLDLSDMLKRKKAFDKELKKKYDRNMDCTVNSKKFEKFRKDVNDYYRGIMAYLNKKDKLRKEKGNLGRYGEARYDAMKKAAIAVYRLKQAVDEFGNEGPKTADYDYKGGKYGVSINGVEKYVAFRKELYSADKQKALEKADAVFASHEKRFVLLSKNVEAAKQDIIDLAVESLYVSNIRKQLDIDASSVGACEDKLRDFNSEMAEYCTAKGKAASLKLFTKELLRDKAFDEEFRSQVLDSVGKGKYKPEDIENCKNAALVKILQKQNKADVQKKVEVKYQMERQNQPGNIKNDIIKK